MLALQIDRDHGTEVILAELEEGVGLPDLVSSPQNEGFAPPGFFPAKQLPLDYPLHGGPLDQQAHLGDSRHESMWRSECGGIIDR
jgi:hypothetical protein